MDLINEEEVLGNGVWAKMGSKVTWAQLCTFKLCDSGGVIAGFHTFPGVHTDKGTEGHVWVVAQVSSELPIPALTHPQT